DLAGDEWSDDGVAEPLLHRRVEGQHPLDDLAGEGDRRLGDDVGGTVSDLDCVFAGGDDPPAKFDVVVREGTAAKGEVDGPGFAGFEGNLGERAQFTGGPAD